MASLRCRTKSIDFGFGNSDFGFRYIDTKSQIPNHKSEIKIPVDAHLLVIYHLRNTGKEVIQKYMSSNHSEVAAA